MKLNIFPFKVHKSALLAVAVSGIFAAQASAQLLVNGSFETNSPGYGGVNNVVNGGVVSGWTLITLSGTSNVSITRPSSSLPTGQEIGYPSAVAGLQYLGFNAQNTTAGNTTIYQDFTTTIGVTYGIAFSVGASSATSGGNQPISIRADAFNVVSGATSGGALGTLTSGGTATGSGGTFFTQDSFNFVATGTTSRLVFTDMTTSTSNVDALLDGVSVSAIPEPSTYAAIAGAGALGLAIWHRRRRAAAPAAVAVPACSCSTPS